MAKLAFICFWSTYKWCFDVFTSYFVVSAFVSVCLVFNAIHGSIKAGEHVGDYVCALWLEVHVHVCACSGGSKGENPAMVPIHFGHGLWSPPRTKRKNKYTYNLTL